MTQDADFHRQVLLGVHAYAHPARQWMFYNAAPVPAVLRPLAEWNPHGIIAHLDNTQFARTLLKLGKPVVDTAAMIEGLDIPAVDFDNPLIAQFAAEHLLARGYRHFGYVGSSWVRYSQLRLAHFRDLIARAGFAVRECYAEYLPRLSNEKSRKSVNAKLGRWLKGLAKPVAVLADHDVAAHDVADVCHVLGLRVPHDVAILGVDNDELECHLAFPPTSSVEVPSRHAGFEAARLLDRMFSGKPVPNKLISLPPVRVVTRQSTSLFAVDEPIVTAALAYIHRHFGQQLRVSAIANELAVCRRLLEKKFRAFLGRSVLDEICRIRIDKVKELLVTTDLSMAEVAEQAGYLTPQRMATVFRQCTGLAPGKYRRQSQVR